MPIKLRYFGKITGYDLVNYLSPVYAGQFDFAAQKAAYLRRKTQIKHLNYRYFTS
jgi:hypothetical protein